jgi:conjugal transfer pilus assembly protein TraK
MFPKSKKSLNAILLTLNLLAINPEVLASRLIAGSDRGHVSVNISAKEQNRLAIEGRRIANVVPSQKGILTTLKDEAAGALYFSLSNEHTNRGTVTLFVTDEQGVTYKLILVPRPIAGEEIILKPPVDKTASAQKPRSEAKALSYQRRIKDLILIMADETLGDRVESEPVNKVLPLWKEGKLTFLTRFKEGDLVGEKYILTNVSRSNMIITEQELYRRGVQAVAIENLTLAPGDTTNFYIVAGKQDNE